MSEPAQSFVATGGCLCGAIRFGLTEKLAPVGFCHCSLCRQASGGVSNAVLNVRRDRFEWVSGEDHVQVYATPSGWKSLFCRTCGCPAPHVLSDGKRVLVPAGVLDGDPDLAISGHIFVGSKAKWEVIGDDGSPQFDEWPT
ncbi:MAG TPA: GFA family protein [Phenylobacterium sp.]